MSDREAERRKSSGEEVPPPTSESGEGRAGAEWPRLVVVWASVLAFGVLFFANVWERDFWSERELRVAAVVEEMEASGDWVIPTLGGEPELSRPPLVFWLSALVDRISNGDARWTYRVPVSACALVSLVLTFWLGGSLFTRTVGFLAMLVQGATWSFFSYSTWLGGDLIFAAFCQLGLGGLAVATRRKQGALRWALLGWFGLAGAALAKSFLLGPVLVFGSLFLFLLIEGGPAAVFRGWSRARVLPGLVLFGALVLPWYIALYLHGGAELLTAHLPEHLGIVPDALRERRPAYVHVAQVVLGYLPWTLCIPLGLYYAKDRLKRSGERLCLVATLFPLLLLSLLPGKEPGDSLFVWPYPALLIAVAFQETAQHFSLWEDYLRVGSLWAARLLFVVPLLVSGVFALTLGVDLTAGESWFTMLLSFVLELFGALPAGGEARLWSALRPPAELAVPLGILVTAATVAFIYSFRLQQRIKEKAYRRAVIELAGVTLCLFVAGGFFYGDANPLVSSRELVERVRDEVGDAPLKLYGARPAAFYYYLSRPFEYLESSGPASGDETSVNRLREYVERAERVYVVAPKGVYDLLRRDYPSLTSRLKEVDRRYLDWSEEMVLLTNK